VNRGADASDPLPPARRRFFTPARTLTLLLMGGGGLWLALAPSAREFVANGTRLLLALDVKGLKEWLQPYHGHAWIATSFLMVLQSLAAPIPAVPITLVNALIYGPWLGALISWSAAELAAAICFALARALGRPFVERLFSRRALGRVDAFFARDGLRAVLVLRLVPFVSFDVVSYAAGLTAMAIVPFLAATGLGQLPATLVYSWAGARLATEVGLAWKVALAFLGGMALIVAGWSWRRRARAARSDDRGDHRVA